MIIINTGAIITLSITAALVITVVVAVVRIKRKLRNFSRRVFGTNSLIEGFNKQRKLESETPRSISAMTSIYLPKILEDFPQFDYELFKNKAKSLLRIYFNAIQTKNPSAITEECSSALKNNVIGIIEDLKFRNVTQIFTEVVIHDVQISRYIKTGASCTILFELSVGHYSYIEDKNGAVVFGEKDYKQQSVYEIGLVYIQDAMQFGSNDVYGINCPNCGSPITNLGSKFCEYCSTPVVEANERVWKFDFVREKTKLRRQY